MKIRWFAAGIAAVLITGGAATVAQRVITQKTRGVLPEKNDSAHTDSRSNDAPIVTPTLALVPSPPEPQRASHPFTQPVLEVQQAGPGLTLPGDGPQPTVMAARTDEPGPVDVAATSSPLEPEPGTLSLSVAPPSESPPSDPVVNRTAQPRPSHDGRRPPPAPVETVQVDPVETVETFVERNRKEAEAAILALGTESENLKTRLAKVEAALVRWQSFSRALKIDQPPAQSLPTPATKPNWKRGTGESSPRPAESGPTVNPTETVKEEIKPAQSAEVPSSPPVSVPPDEITPVPSDVKPTELPHPTEPDRPLTSPNGD